MSIINIVSGRLFPISTVALSGPLPQGLAISGNYVYVLNSFGQTMQMINVSNPSAPVTVATVTTSLGPIAIAVSGNYAYVTTANGNVSNLLQVFNINNPAAPVLVGSVTTGLAPISVAISGNYAYVVNSNSNSNTLQAINISNPSSPVVVGTVNTGLSPASVSVLGNYAFVVNQNGSTLQAINISNPAAPSVESTKTIGSSPLSIATSGTHAYVACGGINAIQVIDLYCHKLLTYDPITSQISSTIPSEYWTQNGNNLYNTVQNCNIGIGTATPQDKLSVGVTSTDVQQVDLRVYDANGSGSWKGSAAFGYTSATVIMGEVGGVATLAGNNSSLSAWANLSINPGGGYVGIGTSSPAYPLDIAATVTTSYTNYGYLISTGASGLWPSSGPVPVSLHTAGRILTAEIDVQSDERIKTNMTHPETADNLQRVNKLNVTDYNYVDKLAKGTNIKRGFIAQEVEKVLPNAVSKSTEVIPSVFAAAERVQVNGTELVITTALAHGFAKGDEILLYDKENKSHRVIITAVNSQRTFTINDWTEKTERIFVYGKKVNDFRTVDFDQITAMSVGAIQELSKKVQQLEDENAKLKAGLSGKADSLALESLKAKIEMLKTAVSTSIK